MKNYFLIKYLLIGFFLTFFINGCSVNDEAESRNSVLFSKSPLFIWESKKVEVSFEDNFQKFESIDSVSTSGKRFGYSLSNNNLKQGVAIRVKVIDSKFEEVNEIMIESFHLKPGLNQIKLGYNNNKPFIIY